MESKTKLPEFEGRLLVPKELRNAFLRVDMLGGDYGKAVLEEYNARVKENYPDNKCLKVFSYKDNVVKGSNTPGNILMNQVISDGNPIIHIATQADLEMILREDLFNLRETYEDIGLVLRSETAPNDYLARDLSKQLRDRKQLEYPVLIHLKDLTLRKDDSSPLGVSFDIKESAEIIYAEILNHKSGNFSSEDMDEKTGLPRKIGSGDRRFYSRVSGLSSLYLSFVLNAIACYVDLANSDDDGRVVVVSAEGAEKFSGALNEYKNKIEAEMKRQINELEVKYHQAMNILK